MRSRGTLLAAGAMLAALLVVGAQAQQQLDSAQRDIEPASDLIGAKVENPQGEDLGSVTDLMIDPRTGQVAYVILSRGGVLGIGADLYPIPWQATRYNRQNERIVVDLTKSQFESAPSFKGDNWPDLSSNTWRQRVHSFYQTRGMGSSQGMPPGQQLFDAQSIQTLSGRITDVSTSATQAGHQQVTLRTDDGRTVLVDLAPNHYLRGQDVNLNVGDEVTVRGSLVEHGGKDMVIATQLRSDGQQVQLRSPQGQPLWRTRAQDGMGAGGTRGRMSDEFDTEASTGTLVRASKFMDKSLRNTQDQRIGEIENFAIDLSNGKVAYLIAGAGGGFLGMGEDRHAIPWRAVQYDAGRQTFTVDISKQRLENAPSFKSNEWPDMSDRAWQSQTEQYYMQGEQREFRDAPMDRSRFQDSRQIE